MSGSLYFGDPEFDIHVPIFIDGRVDAVGFIQHRWGGLSWHVYIVTVDAAQGLFSAHLDECKTLEEAKSAVTAALAAYEGGGS